MERLRENFPFFNNFKGIYADSACKTPIPKQVIEAINRFYENYAGCFYKGGNTLVSEGTELLENARMEVAKFLGARSSGELVWTNGIMDSLNIFIKSINTENNSEIPVLIDLNMSLSLIIPWLNPELGRKYKITFIDFSQHFENGENFKQILEQINPRIVFFPHISHLNGQIYPLNEFIHQIHEYEALSLVDFSHSLSHSTFHVDNQNIDYAIGSFDKNFGPDGIGYLYGNINLMEEMFPKDFFEFSLTEIDLIDNISNSNTTFKFKKVPERFEGLSNNYSGIIGAAESVKFISSIGINKIIDYEQNLSNKFINLIENMIKIDYSTFPFLIEEKKIPFFPLGFNTVNPHDLALLLDSNYNIASNAGFLSSSHILRPLGYRNGINQFSFSIYNLIDDIEKVITSLSEVLDVFS